MSTAVMLSLVTSSASFLFMAISLWLGGYIVTRSLRSRLAWQAGVTLWLLAGIFVNLLVSQNPSPSTAGWLGLPLVLPLAFWYSLSLEIAPSDRLRRRILPFFVFVLAVLEDLLLRGTPWIVVDHKLPITAVIDVPAYGPLYPILPISLAGLSLSALYNFWKARRSASNVALRRQLDSLVRGTFLSVAAIAYLFVATGLDWQAPALPFVLALGLGVAALGYGIARYSALIEGRILRHDFAFSGLLVLSLTAGYIFVLSVLFPPADLQVIIVVVVAALVIFTHTTFEFVRRALDWPFLRRPERALRAALRVAEGSVAEREAMDHGLRSGLAALVMGVDARWGAIALRDGDDFVVKASFHWKRIGSRLPATDLTVNELTIVEPDASARPLTVIAPLLADRELAGVILLGQPKSSTSYGEYDLDLIDEASDRLSVLIRQVQAQEVYAQKIGEMLRAFHTRERQLQEELAALRVSAAARSVDRKRIAAVEDALRRLHDFSYLGEHELALELLVERGTTHLDRGKALNALLVSVVEKLRPDGVEPGDLPPREWHPYLILRDAYVRCEANRDIMSRLYVSEATFHRTRRAALRAVAKALFEMQQSSQPSPSD